MAKIRWNGTAPSRDASGVARDDLGDHNAGIEQGYHYGSLTRGLVGYWRFDDDGTTGTAKDYATNYDGSITGATYTTTAQIGSHALDFTAANRDYVEVGRPLPNTGYTVTAWVKWDATNSTWKRVFANHDSDGGIALGINNTDDGWQLHHKDSSGGYNAAGGTPSTGVWYFVVGWWNGSETRLYVDNTQLGSASVGNLGPGTAVRIGDSKNYNEPWPGIIDDVRLYDRPLSEPELTALYNLTSPSQVTDGDTLL